MLMKLEPCVRSQAKVPGYYSQLSARSMSSAVRLLARGSCSRVLVFLFFVDTFEKIGLGISWKPNLVLS